MSVANKMKLMQLAARRKRYQALPNRWGMTEFCLAAESFRINCLEAFGLNNMLRLCNSAEFGVIYRADNNQPIAVLSISDHEFVLAPYDGAEDEPLFLKLQQAVFAVAREIQEEFRQ